MRALSMVVKKPAHAHDAGLITADRPNDGFFVNRPQRNPMAIGRPEGRRFLPICLAWPGRFAAGSRSGAQRVYLAGPPVRRIPQ
jgi:hypothetical protein